MIASVGPLLVPGRSKNARMSAERRPLPGHQRPSDYTLVREEPVKAFDLRRVTLHRGVSIAEGKQLSELSDGETLANAAADDRGGLHLS